jgi:adenosylhomocysteine nucleosidase
MRIAPDQSKGTILVCFAVKEEADPFLKSLPGQWNLRVKTLVTGMGRVNAENAVAGALESIRPALVITSGFAGGLRPALKREDVLYEFTAASYEKRSAGLEPGGTAGLEIRGTINERDVESALKKAGATGGRIACVDRVAVTAAAKARLRTETGADAVEMESGHISLVCAGRGVPCVTLRVILDTAAEDLPLDFDALMTPDKRLNYLKLAMCLLRAPGKIPQLMKLQKASRVAAASLAEVLNKALAILLGL